MTPRALPCLLLPAAIAATAAIAWFSGNAAQPSAATGQLTGFCTPSPAHLEHASVDPAAMQVLTDRVPASSAPMVTERTVVATDADAAWTELPRLPNDMVRDTVRRPQAVLASTLFRSPAFNPRDMPLATNDRDAIAAVVAARIAGAEAAAAEYESALAREFAAGLTRGTARAIDVGRVNGSLAFVALGCDPLFRTVDGITYGMSQIHMPHTSMLRRRLRTLGRELAEKLAAAFEVAGTLSEAEARTLVARARHMADGG